MQMQTVSISTEDQGRLNKLSELAGSTPEEILPFVLRDGFEETERVAKAVLKAERGIIDGRGVPHEEAKKRIMIALSKHDRQAA